MRPRSHGAWISSRSNACVRTARLPGSRLSTRLGLRDLFGSFYFSGYNVITNANAAKPVLLGDYMMMRVSFREIDISRRC